MEAAKADDVGKVPPGRLIIRPTNYMACHKETITLDVANSALIGIVLQRQRTKTLLSSTLSDTSLLRGNRHCTKQELFVLDQCVKGFVAQLSLLNRDGESQIKVGSII